MSVAVKQSIASTSYSVDRYKAAFLASDGESALVLAS